jgi:hypothetical protein
MVSDRTRAAWLQGCADVAQLVEHHLAKVRVAGSNPVVRSERVSPSPYGEQVPRWSGREARQRTANPCTRVQIPSPPRAIGQIRGTFETVADLPPAPIWDWGSRPEAPCLRREEIESDPLGCAGRECESESTGSAPSPSRAIGAVGARFPDTEEVTGSNPVSPTSITPSHAPCAVPVHA